MQTRLEASSTLKLDVLWVFDAEKGATPFLRCSIYDAGGVKGFVLRAGFGSVSPVMIRKTFLVGLAVVVLCGAASAAQEVGPFYQSFFTNDVSFFAVRPFYSRMTTEEGEVRDYLWPLYSRKSFKDEETSRALIFWFTHHFDTDEEDLRHRRWLIPFYFQGTDVHGEKYFAIFPLGGTIHEFLGRDKILFALFPIFGKSQVNDVKTTSVFWPIYSRSRGDGVKRDRVFPIYGKSVREDRYEKKFILWPFWTSAEYFYDEDFGKAWILFPLIGRANMENEKTLWVFPPFFRFTKGEKMDRVLCPWPFFQKMRSYRRDKLYVWPLWGRDRYEGGLTHRNFVLWPFFWSERIQEKERIRVRRTLLPFFYFERGFRRERGVQKKELEEISKYWKIWPLMSWQRHEQASRFRLLELWPVKNSGPIERNWAPLWTLYNRTRSDGVVRNDALWFVWRSEREPAVERREWSLLKGLLAYKREGDAKSGRLLWIPLGKQ